MSTLRADVEAERLRASTLQAAVHEATREGAAQAERANKLQALLDEQQLHSQQQKQQVAFLETQLQQLERQFEVQPPLAPPNGELPLPLSPRLESNSPARSRRDGVERPSPSPPSPPSPLSPSPPSPLSPSPPSPSLPSPSPPSPSPPSPSQLSPLALDDRVLERASMASPPQASMLAVAAAHQAAAVASSARAKHSPAASQSDEHRSPTVGLGAARLATSQARTERLEAERFEPAARRSRGELEAELLSKELHAAEGGHAAGRASDRAHGVEGLHGIEPIVAGVPERPTIVSATQEAPWAKALGPARMRRASRDGTRQQPSSIAAELKPAREDLGPERLRRPFPEAPLAASEPQQRSSCAEDRDREEVFPETMTFRAAPSEAGHPVETGLRAMVAPVALASPAAKAGPTLTAAETLTPEIMSAGLLRMRAAMDEEWRVHLAQEIAKVRRRFKPPPTLIHTRGDSAPTT